MLDHSWAPVRAACTLDGMLHYSPTTPYVVTSHRSTPRHLRVLFAAVLSVEGHQLRVQTPPMF
jgi:hypothetical protein